MKIGYKALLVALLAAALLAPAAEAKPGNGNGNGPPAWASGGNSGSKANGKSARVEKSESKAQKAARKQERGAARAVALQSNGEPKHQNPAWVCKFEREQMGAEAFVEEYGTGENTANAFGKCVSREAHERDGVADDLEAEASEPGDDKSSVPGDSGEEGTGTNDAVAAVQAFLQSLVQLLF
jgi:hypothetical protein